jgi:hypothetical protein
MWSRCRWGSVAVIFILALGCAPKPPFGGNAPWQEFTSAEGRLSVEFPGSPSTQTISAPTAIGAITAHCFTMEFSDGSFAVAYSDFPSELVQRADVNKMLDGARDGAVANVKGRLVEQSKTSLRNAPGREFLIQINDSAYCRTRIYLAGNRLYQIQVLGNKDQVRSGAADKFLGSFDFKK